MSLKDEAKSQPTVAYKASRKRATCEGKNIVRRPGIEPGSIAWKATMLTFTPPTLAGISRFELSYILSTSVFVAQWIARRTSNPEVAGSNPAEDDVFSKELAK